MSSVTECIAREYFESLGFFVNSPSKHAVTAREKEPYEAIALLIFNPAARQHSPPKQALWNGEDLKHICAAVVGVCGWHTDRFYPKMIETAPDILQFASEQSYREAVRRMGVESPAKILCLPRLPASADLKREVLDGLRQKGIDGVVLFRTMLMELSDFVDVNRNYDKSDLLQTVRLIKHYDMLRDRQMDMFQRARRKSGKPTVEAGDGE